MRTSLLLVAALALGHSFSARAQSKRPLIAVFAHPDDERIVGPLLSRLAREGRETHLVIATDGSKGVRDFANIPAGVGAGRRASEGSELRGQRGSACDNCTCSVSRTAASRRSTRWASCGRRSSAIIDSLKPAVIITFGPEGGTGHPDHRLVGDVVTQIVQGDARYATVDLLYASLPAERLRTAPPAQPTVNGMAEALLTVRVPFEERDLSAGRDEFACHRSQYHSRRRWTPSTVSRARMERHRVAASVERDAARSRDLQTLGSIMPVDVSLLTDVPIFRLLDDSERSTLSALFQERACAAGETIFHRGEPGDELFLVKEGRVHVFITSDIGDKIILTNAVPGDVFGEISLLDGGPRTASAAAVDATTVLMLCRNRLLELVQRHPHVALDLLTVMGHRLRETDELLRQGTVRNLNQEDDDQMTFGERVADRVATFGGSWTFIGIFVFFLTGWIVLNSVFLIKGQLDPFPYILLNLFLSMTAALQAPVIMMSQHRQSEKDRLRADLDYQINLKSELEVAQLHRKLDHLTERFEAATARGKVQVYSSARLNEVVPE